MSLDAGHPTVQSIKQTAIRHLEALDPKARLRSTEYFNHTFIPDLVVQWAQDTTPRFVYLRVSDRLPEFLLDVETVSEQHPIILGMNGIRPDEDETVEALAAKATEGDTFVAELEAVGELGDSRRESIYASLVGSSVARGGRGVLLEDDARDVTDSIEAGFSGAQELDEERVSEATQTAQELLSGVHAARINRLLQAVWIGAGGSGTTFPSAVTLSQRLDVESLNFLLELPELEDREFWRRIGRNLDIRTLAALSETQESENFQHLVTANLDALFARTCHIVDGALNGADGWKWITEAGAFGLRSGDLTAYVAEKAEALDSHPGTRIDGVSVEKLRERSAGRTLTSVTFSDGRDTGDLQSLQGEDILHSEKMTAFTEAWGTQARVHRASALLPLGSTMNLNFQESSASSVTRSLFLLSDLLGHAVPLLRDLGEDEAESLSEFLLVESEDEAMQLDLWGVIETEDEAED
jgi:hypothetical protein